MPTFKPRGRGGLKSKVPYLLGVAVLIWYFNVVGHVLAHFRPHYHKVLPPPHSLTLKGNDIATKSPYIYPPVEDAALLRELGAANLVILAKVRDLDMPEFERTVILSLNANDDPDPEVQKQREEEENKLSDLLRAKNNFKNHDKLVHRPANGEYPEVVVVTAIDFEKYLLELLIKVVQNRVDYAHAHNYGMYVLWYQRFLPKLNALSFLNDLERRKWVRIYSMRAAMHAFPGLTWFWYLDEKGFIMDHAVDLKKYMLEPEVLEPIMLREQPVMLPLGVIKTYRNTRAANVNLIVTQLAEKIETHLFIVKNNPMGRAIVELWGDPLYLNYQNFPNGPDSALTHILQWHPFTLLKLAIVPARTILGKHVVGAADPKLHYHDGDFVVHWGDVNDFGTCEQILNYYSQVQAQAGGK